MVPVSAFAAVVAMAGPQRLAAESSMQEAADDMAMLAVAWRDGQQKPTGELEAFWDQCVEPPDGHDDDLNALNLRIEAAEADSTLFSVDKLLLTAELNRLRRAIGLEDERRLENADALRTEFEKLKKLMGEHEACYQLYEALVRDLGNLGADMGSLRGSYSDALAQSTLAGICSDRTQPTQTDCTTAGAAWTSFGSCSDSDHTTQAACTGAGATWTPTGACSDGTHTTEKDCTDNNGIWTLCRTATEVAVRDAVHVALAASWDEAGWAAAQVWPEGLPMAAESIGRLSQRVDSSANRAAVCGDRLTALDEQGRPVWEDDPNHPSRKLAQSVRRTPLAG